MTISLGSLMVILAALLFPRSMQEETPRVLAYVGSQAITEGEIDFQLGRSQTAPELKFATRQAAIHLIAMQRQALQTLRKLKIAATSTEVDRAIEKSNLSNPEQDHESVIRSKQVSDRTYREHLAFRMSWGRYLAKHLTARNIARHFEHQRQRFDGTRFQIQVLSLRAPAGQSAERTNAREQLNQVFHAYKEAGDWARATDLAGRNKVDVSEKMWVSGTGSLDPSVVSAILKLESGEVSPPLGTASGVHLVYCFDIEPGDLEVEQVRDEVRAHMLIFMLEHLASQSAGSLPLRNRLPE